MHTALVNLIVLNSLSSFALGAAAPGSSATAYPTAIARTIAAPSPSSTSTLNEPTQRLARRKKEESMSLVTTQITVWNRPDLKAFPSADSKNAAWLDMRKQKVVKQYP